MPVKAKIDTASTSRRAIPTEFKLRRSVVITLSALAALAATHPQPVCADPAPNALPVTGKQWVTLGRASASVQGSTMNINVQGQTAVLNWQSFNIGSEAAVNFQQDNATAVAINKIVSENPTQIFGKLTANGQVYLINPNGILFGKTAQVNVGGLVASTLDLTEEALNDGIAGAIHNLKDGKPAPAFAATYGPDGRIINGDIEIQEGASLKSADGGRILVFAPNVVNRGDIQTPNGQTILAAGSKIYLASAKADGNRDDADVAGLVVEVDVSEVDNAALDKFLKGETTELLLGSVHNYGSISSQVGNVSMVGLAVNQSGRVSATTSVRRNGTVLLRAADGISPLNIGGNGGNLANHSPRGGKLTLGSGSVTEITPDYADTSATADVVEQPKSRMDLRGHTVQLLGDSRVTATSGDVTITAQQNTSSSLGTEPDNHSRVFIDDGAVIDVSGAAVSLAAERATVTVQLQSEQLKDSPLQRDSVLKGKTVTVDLRQTGVNADGTTWVGTPLADVTGAIQVVSRTVAERSIEGGSVKINSQGDVIVSAGATIDISGGRRDFEAGVIHTTKLVSEGKIYDISTADPNRHYDGIAGEYTQSSQKWGTSKTWRMPGDTGTYSEAFSQGANAGKLSIDASRMIIDGKVRAEVTAGAYQNTPQSQPSNVGDDVWSALPTTLAQHGQLILGNSAQDSEAIKKYREDSIVFEEQAILQQLKEAGFDPTRDALPETLDHITIRPSLFADGGVGSASVRSNGSITVAAGADVKLASGGSLEVIGSNVQIDGMISVPAGSISAKAVRTGVNSAIDGHDVVVADGAVVDVSGQWVNDDPLLAGNERSQQWINGGKVALSTSAGNVAVKNGARVDASGSAWVKNDGSIKAGNGGSISIVADGDTKSSVDLNGEMSAYGIARGGSVSVTTGQSICISTTDCAGLDTAKSLVLAPEFFQSGGFGSYALTSKFGGLVVASGADVRPEQHNLVLDASYRQKASGADMASFSHVEELLPDIRRPTDIALKSQSELRVDTGAEIVADAGAKLSLSSDSRVWIDGSLQTNGGIIGVTVNDKAQGDDVVANQAIWIGQNATLDVSGVSVLHPSPIGLRTGNVLDGGIVSLTAKAGYVIAEAGSRIDVSGTSATLDLPSAAGGRAAVEVASNAGAVRIKSAEGAVLEGRMDGHAGSSDALGGTLDVTIDAKDRGEPGEFTLASNKSHFSRGDRVIEVVTDVATSDLGGTSYDTLGAAFSDPEAGHAGVAKVRTAMLERGGFDVLELTARNLRTIPDQSNNYVEGLRAYGVVRVDSDLNLARRLVIDAPTLDVSAPAVSINAPYVALGSTEGRVIDNAPTTAVDHALNVNAQWLDLVGHSAIINANTVALHSENDLRLRPVPAVNIEDTLLAMTGSLTATGHLELKADTVYPTTLTDFTLRAEDGAESGSITVLPGDTTHPVLSAGGTLHLQASRIEQSGVLKVPFGTIDLNASGSGADSGTLILAPGSITSTSAEGQVIPVGQSEGGIAWVYNLDSRNRLLFEAGQDPAPAQHIQLSGDNVTLADGAVLDASGGGDMQFYEWVQGLGGSRDILDPAVSPHSFAVMPTFGETIAPFDDHESGEFTSTAIGTTVYLDGVAGLPAGEYAVLPPRYALLPGAFLVTEVFSLRDRPTGSAGALIDGTPVTAGTFGVAGTTQREDRTRGFSVVSSDFLRDTKNVHRPAEYTITLASEFLAQQAADGAVIGRAPADAGIVSISAAAALDLQAQLRGGAAPGGRGAGVDIASENLVVTADGATAPNGAIPISAEVLNKLGAESIFLGGRRSDDAAGTRLNVVSNNVTIADGAKITAPELILAARDQVELTDGASVTGMGGAQADGTTYVVSGDSAVLRVSGGVQSDVLRDASTGTTGSIHVAASAIVVATGSAGFDVTKDLNFAGNIDVHGASLAVGATQINLGAVPAGTSGFNLTSSALDGIDADELQLVGRQAINLWDAPTVTANRLVLDTPLIAAKSGGDDAVTKFTADQVTLRNSSSTPATTGLPGQTHGHLEVTANEIELGRGDSTIAGFSDVRLGARDALLGRDTGSLTVTGANSAANVTIDAGVVSGHRGAVTTLNTQGRVDLLASNPAPATLPDDAIGATLEINAAAIRDAGRIVMPSGGVRLHASGADGVTLADGGVIDASGIVRDFTVTERPSPGGVIEIAADHGNITLASGSHLSVAGATTGAGLGADAGSLILRAPEGIVSVASDLDGGAQSEQRQGRATIDARSIDNIAALNTALNKAAFNDERVIRLREGNLDLTTDITANRIDITVDGGALTVGAPSTVVKLDASGKNGGQVRLAARDNLRLESGAAIDASATEGDGGTVELMSADGGVQTAQGSTITVAHGTNAGAKEGELRLRVKEAMLTPLASGGASPMELKGAVVGGPAIVEGVRVHDLDVVGGVIGDAEIAEARAGADAFMKNAGAISNVLAQNGVDVVVRPGVELRSSFDLTLDTPWDLIGWRFGGDSQIPFSGQPGYLALRAAGDVNINQTLSDGLVFDYLSNTNLPVTGESWSYRIVAGADLGSASPFGLDATSALDGNVKLAPGHVRSDQYDPTVQTAIRTGTGSIEIAAAGNVELGNAASVIYTAGTPVSGISSNLREYLDYIWGFNAAFPEQGGDITIRAGGDMLGAPSHTLITEWLWRMGSEPGSSNSIPTAWGVQYDRFTDGVGALGGGNVTIAAGGNINNVSAAIPTIAVPRGATENDNEPEIIGGGDLRVEAGQDLVGGLYYVGRGTGSFSAGGDVAGDASLGNNPIYTNLALGDGQFSVTARRNVDIGTVFNPTIIPQSSAAGGFGFDPLIGYLTYSPQSRVDLVSIAGDVGLRDTASSTMTDANPSLLQDSSSSPYEDLLRLLPPTLRVEALAGDIAMGHPTPGTANILKLAPAASGQLELLAHGDVQLFDGILLSDANPALLPSPKLAGQVSRRVGEYSPFEQLFTEYLPTFHSFGAPLHAEDHGAAALVVAQTGDVDMSLFNKQAYKTGLWLAKSAEVIAGRDIINPDIVIQNVHDTDISAVSAGRDILYPIARDPRSKVIIAPGIASQRSIVVDGPGDVLVSAGRDVNLGATSAGITTRGNVINPLLADVGASLTVLAGVGSGPEYDAFVNKYLDGGDAYHDALVAYMQSRGATVLGWAEALAQFRALSRDEQMPLLNRIFFTELRTAGRDAATSGSGDYSRGYDAIATLFPNADDQGKLALYFSRIYTLDGGDINLMVPGGEVNVGLAALPTSFGISKDPTQLGIVTQRTGSVNIFARNDVLVNTSRVFAGDGGSILIWSSDGDIDAGRGAKTSISAPPPEITVDPATGQAKIEYKAALNGSGIRAFVTTEGRAAGDVDLFAPSGVINVNDAGIGSAGNITIGATQVIGAENIDVGGVAVGVPVVDTGGLSSALSGASSAAGAATKRAEQNAADSAGANDKTTTPLADAAVSFLEVEVLGFQDDDEEQRKEREAESK